MIKRSLLISSFLFLIVFNALGQSESNFEFESFKTVVKAVFAFMEDYELTRQGQGKNLTSSELEGKDSIKTFLEQLSVDDSIPIKEAEFKEILKSKGWENQGVRTYDRLLKARNEQLQDEQKLVVILEIKPVAIPGLNAESRINQNWEDLKSTLLQKESNEIIDPVDPLTSNRTEDTPVNQKNRLSKSSNNFTSLLMNILIGILLTIIGYILGAKVTATKLENKQSEHRRKANADRDSKKWEQQSKLKHKDNKINDLESKLSKLHKENEHLRSELDAVKPITSSPKLEGIDSGVEKEEPKQPESFSNYFQYPDSSGAFKKAFSKSSQGSDSFYEINYKEGDSHGVLRFVAERSSYGKILSLRDSSLRPVCDIENPSNNPKPSRIEVIEEGKVLIKSDSFKVEQEHKIKIKIS